MSARRGGSIGWPTPIGRSSTRRSWSSRSRQLLRPSPLRRPGAPRCRCADAHHAAQYRTRAAGEILDVLLHRHRANPPDRATARARLYDLLAGRAGDLPIILVRNPQMERLERRARNPNWSAFDALAANRQLVWATPAIRSTGGYVRAVPQRYEASISTLPTLLGAAIAAFGLEKHRTRPWWFHHESRGSLGPLAYPLLGPLPQSHRGGNPHRRLGLHSFAARRRRRRSRCCTRRSS